MCSRSLYTLLKRMIILKDQDLSNVEIRVIDRLNPQGFRELKLSDVEDITSDRLLLRSGGVIPLHRVVTVTIRGRVVWRKSA